MTPEQFTYWLGEGFWSAMALDVAAMSILWAFVWAKKFF